MYIHGLKGPLLSPAQPEHISLSVSAGIAIFHGSNGSKMETFHHLGDGITKHNIAHNRHETERTKWN